MNGDNDGISPTLLEECRLKEALIEQASDGIFVADLTGKYTYVNSAGANMLGYARDEIIGRTIMDFLPPDEVPRLEEAKRALETGATHVAEWHLRRRDGSFIEAEVSAKIFPDGRWQGFVRDIGERKRLERALHQAVADLNRAQAVAHVGSWHLDVPRNTLVWSAEAYHIFGLARGRPLTYETFLSCVHPDDVDYVDKAWAAAMRGEPYHIEHRIIVGGHVRWVAENAELQFDAHGNPVTGVGTVQDITARKQVEAELARAHGESRRLHAELEQVTEASLAISEAVAAAASTEMTAVLQTIVLQAKTLTQARYVALGIGGAEDRPFDAWVQVGMSAETAAAIGRHPRPVGTLGVVAREGRHIRMKNIKEHAAFRGFPPGHPPMSSFMGMPILYRGAAVGNLYLADKEGAPEFTDQDERIIRMLAARVGVAIETASLYRSEALRRLWLQTVINQMPEGVILFDERGRIGSVNTAMARLSCGQTIAYDAYGNAIDFDVREADGTPMNPADNPAVKAMRGETTYAAEQVIRLADGTLVPVLVNAAPIRNDKSEVIGATLVVQDISKLKELERARDEWASIVAHDLRQPVSAIGAAAELLTQLHAGRRSEREAKVVARIKASAQRLNRMIAELLDASLLEAHRLAVRRQPEDLASLLREVVDEQRPLMAGNVIVVEGPAQLNCSVDPDRFRQILENLLSNAVRYGDPGRPVHVSLVAADEGAQVTVTNRGPGIAADQQTRIFSRYVRGLGSGGTARGLGLGLYIVRGLVEAHGGRIWVESTPGETTSFHFTLPCQPARDEIADASARVNEPPPPEAHPPP